MLRIPPLRDVSRNRHPSRYELAGCAAGGVVKEDMFCLFCEVVITIFLLAITATALLTMAGAAVDLFRKVMGG